MRCLFHSRLVLTACLLAAGFLFVPRQVPACGIVWQELWQLKGPFEGVDKQGHALLIWKLAEFDKGDARPGRPIAIYAFFTSDSANRSSMAGYGWCVPFFESRVVQTSPDMFCVYQPDGFQRYFVRDKNDPSVLLAKRPWGGRITGSIFTVQCSCHNEEMHSKLVFRNGRLVSMTVGDGEFTFAYEGSVVSRVQRNGRDFLRTVIERKDGTLMGFEWADGRRVMFGLTMRPEVRVIKGKVSVSGSVLSLGRLTLADGSVKTFGYELRGTNEILMLPEREIGWSAASKLINKDGAWTYSVVPAKAAWDTAAIGRKNNQGQKEFWHDDREKGVLTVEGTDGVRRIEMRFTSGMLCGLLRKKEEFRNGNCTAISNYFYDEKRQLIRFKNEKDDMLFVYGEDGKQAALVNNGNLLRVYTSDGDSLAQPYLK